MKYKESKDGEVKAVELSTKSHELIEESRVLLKILALSALSVEQGKYRPVEEAFALLKSSLKT